MPAEKAASARAAAERIRGRLNAAFIETGRDLALQKEALGHGHFLKWIEAEFGLGERSAQHLINVANLIESNPNHGSDLEKLSQRALRELAAPSTPEPVRNEVLEQVCAVYAYPANYRPFNINGLRYAQFCAYLQFCIV